MNWEPYRTVDGIKFLDTREAVRGHFSVYEDDLQTHARADVGIPYDTYESRGIQILYDKYNRFAAIEVWQPNQVFHLGYNLLGFSIGELKTLFHWDESVIETEREITFFKVGLSVIIRNRKESELPSRIVLFTKDFYNQKIGIPRPNHFSSFRIQVPYIEKPIASSEKENDEVLFQVAFQHTKEKAIILWNGIPIPFDYKNDMAQWWSSIVFLLEKITSEEEGVLDLDLQCEAFQAQWIVKWNDTFVLIDSHWKTPAQMAVFEDKTVRQLTLIKIDFLNEWRFIVTHIKRVYEINNLIAKVQQIEQLEEKMSSYGMMYKALESITKKAI